MKGEVTMEFVVDHDLHIHSQLSSCSRHPEQTPQRILQYAQENDLKTICLTDHFWDETVPGASAWYEKQDFAHISAFRELPQKEGIRFLFGCETELDSELTLGVSPERMEQLDFIVIPTTHFHMKFVLRDEEKESVQGRVEAWLRRLNGVLRMDLPFHKVGLAHLTCHLIGRTREEYLQVLEALPEAQMESLFRLAAEKGVGIEINAEDMKSAVGSEETVLRPYRIAKACGCKFYLGSDSHEPPELEGACEVFRRAVWQLGLTEEDKFRL